MLKLLNNFLKKYHTRKREFLCRTFVFQQVKHSAFVLPVIMTNNQFVITIVRRLPRARHHDGRTLYCELAICSPHRQVLLIRQSEAWRTPSTCSWSPYRTPTTPRKGSTTPTPRVANPRTHPYTWSGRITTMLYLGLGCSSV